MPITEHVSRFYSLALGKSMNFNARTDGLISPGDTTPDVTLYSLLWANTNSPMTITYFDNGVEGQLVAVGNLGSANIAFNGSGIYWIKSAPIATNEFATFIMHNSVWYELFRSRPRSLSLIHI